MEVPFLRMSNIFGGEVNMTQNSITKTGVLVCLVILGLLAASPRLAADEGTQPVPPNLPVQELGQGDLLSIFVLDAPDLSRSARIGDDGNIRLPMLKDPIRAAGLVPNQIERQIAAALRDQGLILQPAVSVTVTEYRSRPVRVIGAVKKPVTFQAIGAVTLADAIARAEGLAPDAGSQIVLERSEKDAAGKTIRVDQHIAVTDLLSRKEIAATELRPDDEIRVPVSGKIYVAGNVQKPGMYLLNDAPNVTVLQALAQSGGLARFAAREAYIYRQEAGKPARTEIPVPVAKLLERKTGDVALYAGDIFYVPDNKGQRMTVGALEKLLQFGSTAGATALIYSAYPGH